jgi:hypothetical protein
VLIVRRVITASDPLVAILVLIAVGAVTLERVSALERGDLALLCYRSEGPAVTTAGGRTPK